MRHLALVPAAAGHLLTPEGQALVANGGDEYPLPESLMSTALDTWARWGVLHTSTAVECLFLKTCEAAAHMRLWARWVCRASLRPCAMCLCPFDCVQPAAAGARDLLLQTQQQPHALRPCYSIKTAPADIVTGIPVPNVPGPEAAVPTPAPAPTQPGSGAAGMAAAAPLLAAALAVVLMLA